MKMTLAKYNPRGYRPTTFSSLLDTFFNESFQDGSKLDFTPSVDIAETGSSFELQVHIPGVKKTDVDISVERDQLTISGERKFEKESDEKNFHSKESYYGKFSRSFQLPDSVNLEEIMAKREDGVLTVSLPKDEKKTIKKTIKIS